MKNRYLHMFNSVNLEIKKSILRHNQKLEKSKSTKVRTVTKEGRQLEKTSDSENRVVRKL